jgi:hypothetical protein
MIRVSYRRDGDQWVGVLKDSANATIVECGHTHTNRDMTTTTGGEAAQVCARMILLGARNQHTADSRARGYRTAWLSLTSTAGFAVPASVIEKVRAEGPARAAAYLARVDQVRQHRDLHTTRQPAPAPAAEPAEVGDMPDWML